MKFLSVLVLSIIFTYSSGAFEVVESSEADPEGGKVETMIIMIDDHQFILSPPFNYSLRVDSVKKELRFSATNRTEIIIQFSSEFPNILPGEAALKANVLNRYSGAAILRSNSCSTGIQPGWLIDVKRVFTPEISLITRHVFVPWANGTVQFALSSDGKDFEDHRHLFNNLLNSFRSESSSK